MYKILPYLTISNSLLVKNMPPRRSSRNVGRGGDRGRGRGQFDRNNETENPNIVELIAQQLQALIPTIVTQVSNNLVNQGNGGSGNNNTNGGVGNVNNGDGDGDANHAGNGKGCTYKEFLACKPRDFDGKGDVLALTRWVEKMESIIDISNCADNQRVKYATSSLINKALTWWNTQIQARGRPAALNMPWEEFKVLLVKEFCPNNELQKLENEFWNHAMVGANHAAYTDRFHELARLVPHLVTPESKRIERYIYGLVPQIRGMVTATEPPTIQSAILKAGTLTDDAIRNGSLTKGNEKRKDGGEPSRQGSTRTNYKRAKVAKGFVAANPVKKECIGSAPKCANCNYHHYQNTPCRSCTTCNRLGHFAKDCRTGAKLVAPMNAINPTGNRGACFECGSTDHYQNVSPRLNRTPGQGGNRPNQALAIGGNQNQGNNGNQIKQIKLVKILTS